MIDVAILGAGISGICMSIQLDKAGIKSYAVFEKSSQLGGTWFDNTYPGAACDVPSHLYSFSFEMKHDWSRKYAGSKEINEYLNFCADKYEIRKNIHLNTEIKSASFDKVNNYWILTTHNNEVFEAKFLVSALGQLNSPNFPNIKGQDDFQGQCFHSAQWDHSTLLENKKIAVIGNGGSAVQFIPHIGKSAKKLIIFQRSAHWGMGRIDFEYSDYQKFIFKKIPWIQRIYRLYIWLQLGSNFYAIVKKTWYSNFVAKTVKAYLGSIVKDPVLLKTLTPDYPLGCKRLLVLENYYETLIQDHVEVTDSPIKEILSNSIIDSNNIEREVDVLIYGTGFQTTKFLSPIEIINHNNISLDQYWVEGPTAHRGITVSEFPNLFLLYGPNTNLGHNSIIFMIECQVKYAISCMSRVIKLKKKFIVPKNEAMKTYNKELQEGLEKTVFSSNCNSWYKNSSGKIINNYHKGHLEYFFENTSPKFKEYKIN